MIKNKYSIKNTRHYPKNGKHQTCIIDLPFDITKGCDSFIYKEKFDSKKYKEYNSEKEWGDDVDNRWIALIDKTHAKMNKSLEKCFSVKLSHDLDKLLKWCERCYILSLEMEIKRLRKEYQTYVC